MIDVQAEALAAERQRALATARASLLDLVRDPRDGPAERAEVLAEVREVRRLHREVLAELETLPPSGEPEALARVEAQVREALRELAEQVARRQAQVSRPVATPTAKRSRRTR